MAVLVESVSIVLRLDAIEQKFQGGAGAFQGIYGASSICSDGELVRMGAATPEAAQQLAKRLETQGLVHLRDGKAADFVVVDQLRGLMSPCDWCEYGAIMRGDQRLQAAQMKGTQQKGLAIPLDWAFEYSHSDAHVRIERKDLPQGAQSLGNVAGMDAYRDPARPSRTLYIAPQGAA